MNCEPPISSLLYPDIEATAANGGAATTNGTIAAAIDDWRRLGLLDLLLNHPGIATDNLDTAGVSTATTTEKISRQMKNDDGQASVTKHKVPSLPNLAQIPRSDWLSVKDGCGSGPKAMGDGKTDDTKALQACFASIGNNSKTHTIWLPAGKYVVKKTLVLYKVTVLNRTHLEARSRCGGCLVCRWLMLDGVA